MSNAKVKAYAQALFAIAQAEGAADAISNELYAVARAYESSDELRNVLVMQLFRPSVDCKLLSS